MEFLSSAELFTPEAFSALGKVLMIDLVLAGDNAVAVGLAAAALAPELRKKAILIGLAAAVVMRIGFALITIQLLAIVGLLMAGGFLLLWVCWKMWREIQEQRTHDQAEAQAELELAAVVVAVVCLDPPGRPSAVELSPCSRRVLHGALGWLLLAVLA